jgi:hypothetical protein
MGGHFGGYWSRPLWKKPPILLSSCENTLAYIPDTLRIHLHP